MNAKNLEKTSNKKNGRHKNKHVEHTFLINILRNNTQKQIDKYNSMFSRACKNNTVLRNRLKIKIMLSSNI